MPSTSASSTPCVPATWMPPNGIERLEGVGLADHVELAGLLHPIELVADAGLIVPVTAELQLG